MLWPVLRLVVLCFYRDGWLRFLHVECRAREGVCLLWGERGTNSLRLLLRRRGRRKRFPKGCFHGFGSMFLAVASVSLVVVVVVVVVEASGRGRGGIHPFEVLLVMCLRRGVVVIYEVFGVGMVALGT